MVAPDVTYSKLQVNYTNAALDLNGDIPLYPNAWMDFVSNMAPTSTIKFEAILYDDEFCQGDVIGKTNGALLSSDYLGSPSVKKVHNFIKLEIDSSLPAPGTSLAPRLNIFAHPKTFQLPYYKQNYGCSNSLGETNPTDPSEYNNNPDSKCGLFQGCVEFQMLHCNNKADFVDVQMQIEFDLLENCDDDFCGEIRFVRGPQFEDGEDTDIGQLFCYPCDRTSPSAPLVVKQGQAVNFCLDVSYSLLAQNLFLLFFV